MYYTDNKGDGFGSNRAQSLTEYKYRRTGDGWGQGINRHLEHYNRGQPIR